MAVGAAAFALYLWLSPTVSGDRDSSEFTLVLALDGVAHPTGYTLYTLFGHAFVRAAHALGATWPFAANAWSALGGAVAVAFLHALGAGLVPARVPAAAIERWLPPLLPVALLVLHPAWTQVTTVAEVYSWHQAWALALATAFVAWMRHASEPADASPGRALLWGLLCGAGLAHHATALLLVVPLTVALVVSGRLPVRRATWSAAGLAVIPLASLALLHARLQHPGPAHWITLEDSWAAAWRHVTGAQYRGLFGRYAPEPMDRQLIEQHVLPLLLPGLVALGAAWRVASAGAGRAALAGLAAAALAQTAFAFGYGVEDPSAYFLPALALALVALVPLLAAAALHPGARRAALAAAVAVAVLASLAWPGQVRSAREQRDTLTGLDAFVHQQWERIPDGPGLVLWARDMHVRLREYQSFRGEKRALEVWNPYLLLDPVARRRFRERHGFDPVGELTLGRDALLAAPGASPGADRFLAAVARRIDALSPLPVIVFEPEVPRVTVLPKRGSPAH